MRCTPVNRATSDLRVDALLAAAVALLQESPTARLDAEILVGHVLGRARAWVLARGDAEVTARDRDRFMHLVERRLRGEPVAYLTGVKEWYGLKLEVNPSVLIPRPETELLGERAAKVAGELRAQRVADIGTGSGALAMQMATLLSEIEVHAVDCSDQALAVARRNAQRAGLQDRITFFRGDLLQPLTVAPDLIVANLPYLSGAMMATLDRDVRFEPPSALYGGASGLDLYARLFGQLADRGWRAPTVIEIDPRQAEQMRLLAADRLAGWSVVIDRDYAGRDRVVTVRPPELA